MHACLPLRGKKRMIKGGKKKRMHACLSANGHMAVHHRLHAGHYNRANQNNQGMADLDELSAEDSCGKEASKQAKQTSKQDGKKASKHCNASTTQFVTLTTETVNQSAASVQTTSCRKPTNSSHALTAKAARCLWQTHSWMTKASKLWCPLSLN